MGTETILVVEDDPDVQDMAETMLKELGYRVLTAGDGSTALVTLTENTGVDLVFTDVVLPGGMLGFELGKEIRARFPDIKILYTSGHVARVDQRTGEFTEDGSWLHKPYSKSDLAQKVREVLDG